MISLPIPLPPDYRPLVSQGDPVQKGQVIAKPAPTVTSKSSVEDVFSEVSISLPENFNEKPERVGNYLLKSPGENISVGEIIAVKKGGLSLKKIKLVSQVEGTVFKFERASGNLIIKVLQQTKTGDNITETKLNEIYSPLEGIVTICNNEKIVIESATEALVGIRGTGREVIGELLIYESDKESEDEEESLNPSSLNQNTIDKILLVQRVGKEAIVKADTIGVKGIIATAIDDADFRYIVDKHSDFPLLEVGEDVRKKLLKVKKAELILNGREKTIIIN